MRQELSCTLGVSSTQAFSLICQSRTEGRVQGLSSVLGSLEIEEFQFYVTDEILAAPEASSTSGKAVAKVVASVQKIS